MLDLQKALNKPTNPNSRPSRQLIGIKEHLTAIASVLPTKPDLAVTLIDDVIGSLIEIRRTVRSYIPGETLVLPEAPAAKAVEPKAAEPVREEVKPKSKPTRKPVEAAPEPVAAAPEPVAAEPVVEPVAEAALPPALDASDLPVEDK